MSEPKSVPVIKKGAPPWVAEAIRILADHEWHDYDEVVEQLIPLIPPGMAVRRAERNRVKCKAPNGADAPEERKVKRDTTTLIRIGARIEVTIALRSLRNNGRVEVERGKKPPHNRELPLRIRLGDSQRRVPRKRKRSSSPWTTIRKESHGNSQ